MSRTHSPGPGNDARTPVVDNPLELFEATWRKGPPPRLEEFLAAACPAGGDVQARRTLLNELLLIDLDYRWRHATRNGTQTAEATAQTRLEQYLAAFPELGPADRCAEPLICEEYRVRRFWKDRAIHEEYAKRFPRQWPH